MVPNGWKEIKLGDLCTKITDGAHHSPKSVEKGYPMYSVKDMSNKGFFKNTARLISKDDYEALVKQNCKPLADDILIAKDGSILKHCFVMQEDCDGVILSSIALLRPKDNLVSPYYLAHYFAQDWVKVFVVRALTSGSGVPRIILKDFKTIKIPTPPLPEQQKIAKILTTWDKAINTTESLIENSKQQKKALMQQLLTGQKRLLDDSGQRFSGNWEEAQVSDYFEVGSSKRVLQEDWQESGVPFYRTRELVSLAKKEPFSSSIFISEKLYKDIIDKYGMPSEDDFLVSGVGTLGIIYQVKNGDKFYFKDGNVLWFKKKSEISSDFFKYMFLSDYVQHQIDLQSSVTTVGTYTIKNAKVTKFLCPPIQEQQKIAAVLTNADREIEVLEQQLADLQQEKKALMQQLLTGKKRVKVD
jgi:type I restriction enzyme, S subunit